MEIHPSSFLMVWFLNGRVQLYSALCLFPCLSKLRIEPTLKAVKRNWGAAVPRYHTFYRVQPLINTLAKSVI